MTFTSEYFFFDYETASEIDLSERGLDNYARHKSTRILMMSYASGENPGELWEPRLGSLPEKIRAKLLDPAIKKICWNATFEWNITKHVLGIEIPFDQFLDVMVWARHLSLPGSLEDCGEVLGLKEEEAKIKDGKRLIHKFCEPFRLGGEETLFGITEPEFHDSVSDPEDWEKFRQYCLRDCETERTLLKIMMKLPLPEIEQKGWELDQKINQRGVPVNVRFVDNALALAQKSKDTLQKVLKEKTALENPNSRDQILEWAKGQGYPFESMGKAFVTAAIADPGLTPLGQEVLKIRQEASKTSFKKFEKIKNIVSFDQMLRNQFMFMGAPRSGRWSGSGVQIHNLPRPNKAVEKNYARAIWLVLNGDYEIAAKEFPSIIDLVTSVTRSFVQAPVGKRLDVSDLSAIENRVLGWVAGCDAILKVFRDGLDPYVSFAVKIYNELYEVLIKDKDKRQVAKPAVLGAGYGLGPGVKRLPDGKYEIIWIRDKYGNQVKTGLLGYAENMGIKLTPEQAYLAWEVFRKSYPEVVKLWRDLEDAAFQVVKKGGHVKVGPVEFSRVKRADGTFVMRILLPSGRSLHYMNMRIENRPIINPKTGQSEMKATLTYDGIGHGVGAVAGVSGFGKVYTYGGKLTENIVQAISRDILLHGMFLVEELGGEIIMHVHDEIVTMADESDPFAFGFEDLKWCMSQTPAWADEKLPLAADGYSGKIYKKG